MFKCVKFMTQPPENRLKKTNTDTLKKKNNRKQNTTKELYKLSNKNQKENVWPNDNFKAVKLVKGFTSTGT
jgi:hypothetical protein